PSGDSAGKGGDISVARSGCPPGGLSVSTRGVAMSSRQVFRVVVRTLGLLIILAGGHRIFYAFASSVLFRAHFPWHVYLVAGLVYLAAGAVLMWGRSGLCGSLMAPNLDPFNDQFAEAST